MKEKINKLFDIYKNKDSIYDFESLKNATTLSILVPNEKRLIVGLELESASTQINNYLDNSVLTDVAKKKKVIDNILIVNKDIFRGMNMTEENIELIPLGDAVDFLIEDAVAINKSYVYGFNSNTYDVPLLCYIKARMNEFDEAEKTAKNITKSKDVNENKLRTDTTVIRDFSDQMIQDNVSGNALAFGFGRDKYGRSIAKDDAFAKLYRTSGKASFDTKEQREQNIGVSPYYLDIRPLNEHMKMASLKRLSAQDGLKVLTSEKLKNGVDVLTSIDELADLLAYNVSDVFNTALLFTESNYQDALNTRIGLLERYGQNLYKNAGLKRDSTSAKLIQNVIAPNNHLIDDYVVTNAYPVKYGYLLDDKEKTFEEVNNLADENSMLTKLWELALQSRNIKNEFLLEDKEYIDDLIKTLENIPLYEDKYSKMAPQKMPRQIEKDTGVPKSFAKYFVKMLNNLRKKNIKTPNTLKDDLIFFEQASLFFNKTNKMFPKVNLAHNEQYIDCFLNHILVYLHENLLPMYSEQLKDYFYDTEIKNNQTIIHQRLVVHQNVIQFDLLEELKFTYGLDEKAYIYYSHFRNQNMADESISKSIPRTLKSITLENGQVTDLSAGCDILLPYGADSYINMSIGGAHGNIVDRTSYETYEKEFDEAYDNRQKVINHYLAKTNGDLEQAAILARLTKRDGFEQIDLDEGIDKLEPYTYTTGTYKKAKFKGQAKKKKIKDFTITLDVTNAVHVDISSYYPTLLSLLKTFKNGKEDPYNERRLERLKAKASLPALKSDYTKEDWHTFNTAVTANKLLLNSASGAGDTSYDNPIKVTNKIYRMRIAGQLLITALSFDMAKAKATPNSINTDGIYVNGITLEEANNVIELWATKFELDADGEQLDRFITKDSNNRIEIDNGKVQSANGGTVSNWKGSNINKSIAAPTITDETLVNYLLAVDKPLEHEFSREIAKSYMQMKLRELSDYLAKEQDADKRRLKTTEMLLKFQYITTSTESKNRYYVFLNDEEESFYPGPINRSFIVNEDDALNLGENPLGLRLVTINKQNKQDDDLAVEIAESHNLNPENMENLHTKFMKISDVDDETRFVIKNDSVDKIDPDLLQVLDLDNYVRIVETKFKNWSEKQKTIR